MYRTHTCGELNKKDVGKTVQLSGWANSVRDHGGLIFIDLRDRYGITQCTADPKFSKQSWETAEKVKSEYVVQLEGDVRSRPKEMINENLNTGEIEVYITSITILTKAKTPPFEIEWKPDIPKEVQKLDEKGQYANISEEIRLKYRYLDLRKKRMLSNIKLRYYLIKYIRDYLHHENFIEIETPILTKSTPEGARDYIVPSRIHKGEFYALPQSPQQYKQLLMVAGIDKYFQIARCFRDEDQRGDRQPEFTQLDIEMSFVERDDVLQLTENLFKSVFKRLKEDRILNKDFVQDESWPKLNYADSMLHYGTDRPDIRFDLKIKDLSDIAKKSEFQVFLSAVAQNGGVVRAINAKEACHKFSRKDIDELTTFVQNLGAQGLAYIKINDAQKNKNLKENEKKITINDIKLPISSPILKYLSDNETHAILDKMKVCPGDIIFFGAGSKKIVETTLCELRLLLGKKLKLINEKSLASAWIINFPLFEPEMEDGHYAPSHHMFTSPDPKDLNLLETEPHKVCSWQYDLVINGYEVGGGSIRIHDPKIQERIFDLVGFSEEKKKEFKHMLEAFTYGVPPHGGIAPGLDRIAMLLAGETNIREVIAFPKNQKAEDVMMSAPSPVEENQLKEVHISLASE